jgi:hypothetical protein
MVVVGTSTTAAAAVARFSQHLVACNIYVSAGRPQYAPLLLTLLQDAQDHCSRLKAKQGRDGGIGAASIAMVHAYADDPYDRSSFHLAGTPSHVAAVAGNLATSAVKSLLDYQGQNSSTTTTNTNNNSADSTATTTTMHPTVGIVDHIAVMPLQETNEVFTLDQVCHLLPLTQDDEDMPVSTIPSGWVARSLGHAMMKYGSGGGVKVLYYGSAHPQQTPLATVRRESTHFFKSLPDQHHSIASASAAAGQAIVGAPPRFAENYNLRLSPRVSQKQARTLTKRVRARDGGLPGVEALTLAYSGNRWEVACNLLRPDLASAQDIQAVVDTWELEQHAQAGRTPAPGAQENLVERGYRVGTTVEQCLEALERTTCTAKSEQMYNQMVRDRFERYLQSLD